MDTTGIKIESKYKKFNACGPGKRCVLKKDNSKSDTTKSAPLKSGKDTTRIEAPKREKRKIQILDDSLLKSQLLKVDIKKLFESGQVKPVPLPPGL